MIDQLLTLTVVRKKCGLTQQQLATAIGTKQETISEWERNRRTIPAKHAIAIKHYLRKLNRSAVAGIHPVDLQKPWEQVFLRLIGIGD